MTEPTTPDPRDPEYVPPVVEPKSDITDDDLGPGAFDTDPVGDTDPVDEQTTTDEHEHDKDPKKAYVGRPELTPLYAMAGVADLAASMVREIVNEQIAAYRARHAKDEPTAESTDTPGAEGPTTEDGTKDTNAQFNEFLTKAQQRTQEIFDQAVAQYEHLADRGRVAVGDILDAAKQQQKARQEAEAAEAAEGTSDSPASPASPDSPASPGSPDSPRD